MSSQAPKSSKPSKPPNQSSANSTTPSRQSSSLSSHLAMVEMKQRILTSLSKLSDRDTHQIAVEDLEKIIQTLSNDGVPMLLNCLYDAAGDPKPTVKKESLRLLAVLCGSHSDSTSPHLTKIIAHIVKRLKDSDSAVRDACRDAIGSLSAQYLKGEGDNAGLGSVVSLFVKPLFEAMNENNKVVQAGAAMCMAKMVDCASDPPLPAFQKLCPRVCKYLNSPNFFAKASLLLVVASLSQVGAISPQSLETLLQSIHECLGSTDWATRKAAADTLNALGLHSSNLIKEGAASTLTVLEACRFDKIKPVRDSMNEALQLWKKVAGKGEASSDDQKTSCDDNKNSDPANYSENAPPNSNQSVKDSSNGSSSSPSDSTSKVKNGIISDRAIGILKKKAPGLTDKEINPEFFQKLEKRGSDDLPVEVVVPPPRRCVNSPPAPHNLEEESEPHDSDSRVRSKGSFLSEDGFNNVKYRNIIDRSESKQRESSSGLRLGQSDGFMNNKGNWLAIQRQLLQLERQQSHLMNMLQDFMGGSHDGMVTLENRVRGLERIVEDMARDLSISTARRGSNFMSGFDGPSNRSLGKYNGFPDYSSAAKLGRNGDGWGPFGDRFTSSRRPEGTESWNYVKNGQIGSRRGLNSGPIDVRSPRSDHENDQIGPRRAWDKGAGPSARGVWQASKDEATLEAIRVVAIPELTAEAMGDENGGGRERDPVWTAWSNAMDAVHVGDLDSAFAEVLSTGDDLLLVKLMDRSGPVVDQLSTEVGSEVLHAVAQFLLEPNLFDVCLSWIQQLAELVVENGTDVWDIPTDVKRELLLNLNEAASAIETPEDWEGATPDQLLSQLASSWEIDLRQLNK